MSILGKGVLKGRGFGLALAVAITLWTSACAGAGGQSAAPHASPPPLSANPGSVAFGDVIVGSSSTQTVSLTNTGSSNLVVTQASVSGTGFSISGVALPLNLAPGQTGTFSAQFSPADENTVSGNVSVASAATNSPTLVSLSGRGRKRKLSVSPTSLSFGNVTVGSSASQSVTLTSTGTATVTISAVTSSGSGFSTTGITLPRTLAPGQALTFSVVFTPPVATNYSDTISIVSDDTGSPAVTSLSGTGAPSPQPQVSIAPTSVSFGSVLVGNTGTQVISLTNSGTASLTVSQANVSGSTFSLSGLALPLTLAAGQSTTFNAQFAPTAAGNVSGSVSLVSNAPNSPSVIPLSGTGTANTLQLSASPASVSFGNVNVGSSSTAQPVTLTNTGNSSVTISQVSATGAAFSIGGIVPPLTLASTQSTTFTAQFAPASAGSATGNVTVVSNATSSPNVIPLSGTGVQAQLSVSPANGSFGNVTVGTTNTLPIILTNSGSANLTISQATVSGNGFSISGLTTPLTLTPGQATNFNVAFAPASAGSVTGSVSLVSNAPSSPTSIPLSGTGVATTLLLAASPTSLSFGNVTTGTGSTQSVTLSNTGNSSVTISQISTAGAGFSTSGLTPPVTLTAGQTATLNVTFAPTAAGTSAGNATVISNATNSPANIAVTGNGVLPAAAVAFPGGQGGGAQSVGGRGGTVYFVTNTNDSGPGSLRTCVDAMGPRTCVFRTGGTIALLSSLTIANPFITIAGQTAPGGGIQLRGPSGALASSNPVMYITTHDVVVQYLRIRRGHNGGELCNQSPWSCGANIVVLSNNSAHNPYNIAVDHVSSEWSNYEAFVLLGGNSATNYPRSITVSHSILAESLAAAGQTTIVAAGGYSGQGSMAPDNMTDLDFHHTLFAGASHRLPLVTMKSARLVNNFVYGWTYYATRHKGQRDFVNNYFKLRNGQIVPTREIQAWTTNDGNDTSFAPSFYVSGNIGPNDPTGTLNWAGVTALTVNQSGSELSSPLSITFQRSTPIPTPAGYIAITPDPVSAVSSASGPMMNTARMAPYDGVGASRKVGCKGGWEDARDSVDSRIVNAVVNGTTLFGSYTYQSLATSPQTQVDLGGWPALAAGSSCTDGNNNGLPDAWESYWAGVFRLGVSLNPNAFNFGDGYTNLEHYIHAMNPAP